jgi:hypothetical protein
MTISDNEEAAAMPSTPPTPITRRARTARLLLRAMPVALPLLGAGTATAQLAPPPAPSAPRTVVTAPLQDLPPAGTIGERAERLWSDVMDMFGFSAGSSHFMRSHGAMQRGRQQQDDFAWLMDIAGYKLKEIESSVGLIPTLGLTFGQARELTEADRDYVERMLERHARRNPGPMSVIQRTIVRGILDATEIGGFSVDKVEVDLFPLPKVKFVLTPTDAPLGIEASRILRAIDRLNLRVQGMAPRQQGLDLPPRTEGRALRPASLEH